MTESNQLLSELVERLQPQAAPVVPLDRAWWSARQVAAYFDCNPRHVTERLSALPGFPEAKRMPSAKGMGNLRWRAKEIIKWWESQ